MSKKLKLTPWFPADVEPVRAGEYEVHRLVGRGYPSRSRLHWSPVFGWSHTNHSSLGFAGARAAMLKSDGDKWRGLAEDPNA